MLLTMDGEQDVDLLELIRPSTSVTVLHHGDTVAIPPMIKQ